MNKLIYSVLVFAIAALYSCQTAPTVTNAVVDAGLTDSHDTIQTPMDNQTQAIVDTITTFLNLLSPEQQQKIQFDFVPQEKGMAATFKRAGMGGGSGNGGERPPMAGDSNRQRPNNGGYPGNPGNNKDKPAGGGKGMGAFPGFIGEQYGKAVWSNYPVSDVPRPGLQLGSLSTKQREAAMNLLQELLSPKGYQKVLEIMGADQALADGGTNYASGTAVYTLGIFGKPSTTKPWMVQFGGHHLGLNIVIAGKNGVLTPTLTGAQPAVYIVNGKQVRALAQENDKAFALLNALDEKQRKQAILNYEIADLVLGPGKDGETIVPEGLKASAMNGKQRTMLLDLINEWAGIINDAYSETRMEEIKAGLKDTYFAWSGPTTHEPGKNGAAYYRIQGPKVIIEFSPQGVGGDLTMHVHTIYRDPTNEYGSAFTAK